MKTYQGSHAFLLVANWDSNVGYAWWLMESFWAAIATHYYQRFRIILAYPRVGDLPEIVSEAPLEIIEYDFTDTRFTSVAGQCQFIRQKGIRYIYLSDHPMLHWRYAIFRLMGVQRIIVHDHTPGLRAPSTTLHKWAKRLMHRIRYVSVDGAIGATEFVRRRLVNTNGLPPRRCFTAPNGLPQDAPSPTPIDLHSVFNIPEERRIMAMAGRADPYKRVDFVLRCIARLRSIGNNRVHFLFIGDGPALARFRELAQELAVSDACTFPGFTPNVRPLLEGADLAIHPSTGEVGYSLAILEYMQAGLPVIVPDNPSVCDATEHGVTGLIFEENSVEAASASIQLLLENDKLRRSLGRQARVKVAQCYKLSDAHTALIRALDSLLA